jgi:hypothetical protein
MSEDLKILHVRNRPGVDGFVQLIEQAIEAAKEGWEIDKSQVGIYTGPLCRGQFRITMKKGEELLAAETKEEKLPLLEDPKASKADLLTFAEEMKLEVPADKKSPAAIKKFIKDNLPGDGEVGPRAVASVTSYMLGGEELNETGHISSYDIKMLGVEGKADQE